MVVQKYYPFKISILFQNFIPPCFNGMQNKIEIIINRNNTSVKSSAIANPAIKKGHKICNDFLLTGHLRSFVAVVFARKRPVEWKCQSNFQ